MALTEERKAYWREYRRKKRATDPAWVEQKKERSRERDRKKRATDPAWVEQKNARDRERHNTILGRARALCTRARKRASEKGIPHTLTVEWVSERLYPLRCEATGVALNLSAGRMAFNSPSLDQRIAGEGYTPENTRVVCWGWNAMCGTWGDDVADAILEARLAFRRGT